MIYLELIWGFLKVGTFSFGGAYAAIPLVRDVVLSYGWMDDDMVSYMIAVSESTPGPIMVNMATYVGSSQGGLLGAILGTTMVVLPSFLVILAVMAILKTALKNKYVQAALSGLKPCIMGIILATGIYMIFRNCSIQQSPYIPEIRRVAVTAVLLLIFYGGRKVLKKKISPILLIVLSACIGIVVF